MRKLVRTCLLTVGLLAVVSGCSGSCDSEGTTSVDNDTGSCDTCGEESVDAATDAGDAASGRVLLGTCLDRKGSANEEGLFCWVNWAPASSDTPKSKAQQNYKEDCLQGEPENEWKSGEAACPTGDDYVGTCEVDLGIVYQQEYYYEPEDPAKVKSDCRDGGGTWTVE